jgi:predicted acylesterase/phospholipase RssA
MLNNIPCDVMQRFCPGPMVACDVSRALALKVPSDLDCCPGPARQIWDRIKALCGQPAGYPGIASILTTSVDCSAATQKEETRALAWLYLTPPVESFGMLETERIDEIIDIGYEYTRDVLSQTDLTGLQESGSSAHRQTQRGVS